MIHIKSINELTQKHKYCPACGEELIETLGTLSCSRCNGEDKYNAKLNSKVSEYSDTCCKNENITIFKINENWYEKWSNGRNNKYPKYDGHMVNVKNINDIVEDIDNRLNKLEPEKTSKPWNIKESATYQGMNINWHLENIYGEIEKIKQFVKYEKPKKSKPKWRDNGENWMNG